MLRNLLGFEFNLHIRSIGFWIAFVVMIGMGVLFSSVEGFSIGAGVGERVKANGAIPIALTLSFFSLFSIFFAALFVVTGVMRDDVHGSVEVMHSTPIKTPTMLISRMLGVWFATILALSGLQIGTMIGPFMPWIDEPTFKSYNLLDYIQPFFLFIVINALFLSAVYTLIATVTRNKALVYVSAVGMIVLYLGSSLIAGEDPADWVAALIDPFGTTPLALATEYWSADQQNTQRAPVWGWIGVNRLLYAGIGLALFATSFVLSRRGIVIRRGKKTFDDSVVVPPRQVKPVAPSLGSGFTLSAFWTRVKFEYLATVRSTPFVILMSIAASLFALVLGVTVFMGESRTIPTSSFMADVSLGSLSLPMLIIMVFFGSDIMWRDRTANMHGILDATPVRSVSLLFAKWGAMALLLLTLILFMLVLGMINQPLVNGGRTDVIPSTFLALGVAGTFVRVFFLAMLVMFIQNFMPGRVIGMLVAAGLLIALPFASQLPFYHPLMSFGSVSAGAYSEMGGFSFVKQFGWEFAYWMGLILILGALSVWVWRRGLQTGLGYRLRTMRDRFTIPSLATAALGVAMFVGFGFAGLQSYRAQEYMNSDQREANQADFERLVADRWQDAPPRITDVSVNADFRPSARTALFDARFVIDNPHDEPLSRTTIYTAVGLKNLLDLKIEGAYEVKGEAFADELREEQDVLDIRFDPPMQPGESREVTFKTRFTAPTLTDNSAIRSNGTFVNNSRALIVFGNLQAGFLSNPDQRRKQGLGEPIRLPDRDDAEARRYHLLTGFSGYADYVNFDAEVCTDESQIPVAPGKLRGETIKDGRRCRSYKSINPILNFFSFLSAEYEHREQSWTGDNGQSVLLEIYFHPQHDYNVDLMFKAMETSMDTYTELFSDYQYAQLRIMEFPYSSFAQAFAGTVPFSENIGFVQDPGSVTDPKQVDYASYVVMHEIGHQWFAHQLVGANVKGSNLLSEGLTDYVTMLAYERQYDFAKARRMHEERTTKSYLTARTFESDLEPVLAESEGQGYLDYNKTSWVMWGLRGYLGDEPVRLAVKRFLDEYNASHGAPYPTTLELIDVFREEFPVEYHALIEDYWNKITFWEMGIDGDVEITPVGDRFEVTIPVKMKKTYADSEDGKETDVTELDDAKLNEFVQVGFFSEDPKDDLGANPVSLEMATINAAEQVLTFTVDTRPTHIVLDPKRLLIERNTGDNVARVETDGDAASSTGN